MVLLRNFVNIFVIPELRKKFLFTLGILIIYRLGNHIPVIGVNVSALQALMQNRSDGILGKLFSYIDMFSGGDLAKCTIFALGIMPYITSSIVMQMLGLSIPSLQALLKEGEYGRKIINQYTRYLTFAVSISQGWAYAIVLERSGLVVQPGWAFRTMFILSLTVGSMFVMWLGEQISQFGIGNGSSMIIFAGIVARYPGDVARTVAAVREGILRGGVVSAIILLALIVIIAACIVFLERGERKVPVQYARRVVGQRVYGGQSTYIPFKVNTAGVMPIIFASAILNIPMLLFAALASKFSQYPALETLRNMFLGGGILYNVLMFLLIIFFSFYYTALVFDPDELADNIKKSGGFIPGIRPGRKTAEFFNYILTRLGFIGALYLGSLAMFPVIVMAIFHPPFFESGTGLLIVVGVALDMAAQIESYLIEHRYEGFLSTGRLKGRWGA